LLHAVGYDLDRCDPRRVWQTIRQPIKDRSKVALHFPGAQFAMLRS
jgi:hypothetical protein